MRVAKDITRLILRDNDAHRLMGCGVWLLVSAVLLPLPSHAGYIEIDSTTSTPGTETQMVHPTIAPAPALPPAMHLLTNGPSVLPQTRRQGLDRAAPKRVVDTYQQALKLKAAPSLATATLARSELQAAHLPLPSTASQRTASGVAPQPLARLPEPKLQVLTHNLPHVQAVATSVIVTPPQGVSHDRPLHPGLDNNHVTLEHLPTHPAPRPQMPAATLTTTATLPKAITGIRASKQAVLAIPNLTPRQLLTFNSLVQTHTSSPLALTVSPRPQTLPRPTVALADPISLLPPKSTPLPAAAPGIASPATLGLARTAPSLVPHPLTLAFLSTSKVTPAVPAELAAELLTLTAQQKPLLARTPSDLSTTPALPLSASRPTVGATANSGLGTASASSPAAPPIVTAMLLPTDTVRAVSAPANVTPAVAIAPLPALLPIAKMPAPAAPSLLTPVAFNTTMTAPPAPGSGIGFSRQAAPTPVSAAFMSATPPTVQPAHDAAMNLIPHTNLSTTVPKFQDFIPPAESKDEPHSKPLHDPSKPWSDQIEVLERENIALREKLHLNETDRFSDIRVDAVAQIHEEVLRARVAELEKEIDKLHMKHDGALPQKTSTDILSSLKIPPTPAQLPATQGGDAKAPDKKP